jgi:effector-binding domain-containing protein
MIKVLKVIGALVIIVVVVFLIAGLLGPKEFKMERSILIHAPRSVIFANISDYRNWQKWSPWAKIDTNCKYEYAGPQGQADASYKWAGNDKVGEGEMRTTEIAQDQYLVSRLTFLKPWKSQSVATFRLDSADHGDIKVTWSYDQHYGFSQRPMMLFINMEKMLAPDYEKGLVNLKTESEGDANRAMSATEVYVVDRGKKTYVAYRTTTTFDSISDVFQTWMPKVYAYVTENKLMMDGVPTGLYYTWDADKKRTDMAVGIPVRSVDKVSGDLVILSIDAQKALENDYYGPYDKMGPAHELVSNYITDKKLKKKAPVLEEYVTDPTTEKDSSKVLTRIIYHTDGGLDNAD